MNEDQLEQHCLDWFREGGWEILYGPDSNNPEGWLNQHIFKLNFNLIKQKHFSYFFLKQIKLLIRTAEQKQTTGLGHVTVADMKRVKIVYPNNPVLEEFSQKICPLYEKSSNLIKEVNTLTQLRDTLLPKLLSGELNVTD